MVECLHESGMEFDSKLGMEYNFVEHQMSDGVELELHAKDSVTEPCNINEIGPHACNDVMDVANGSHLNMDIVKEMPPGKSGLKWVAIDSTEPQDPVERHMNDVYDVTEFKPNSESEVKEVELECCMGTHEGFVAGLETEIPIDVDVVPEIEMNKYDIKRYTESCTPEVLEGDSIKLFDSVKDLKEAHDGICHESCTKLERKDFSNSDSCSEVSNPIPSPKQVISNSTISSLPSDVIDGFHGGCGEITSVCSLNSGAVAEEERTRCKVESVSTSHVVLEIPKHLRPTGIRKITFKFNKRKESCGNEQSVAVKPMAQGDICGGLHGKHKSVCADTCNGSHKHASNNVENSETNASVDWSEFNDTHHPSSCVPNRELKMSKKIVPDNYPSNVKKLLSTRILEGARVKYISTNGEKQLPGVIKGCGYLCGCSLCNFSKVVTAYEFEIHAGSKTRLPNNHIHLENGKPIYSIIQELRMAPLGAVEEVIKSVAGSSVNEEYFQLWKSNLEHSNTINSMDSLCQSQQSTLHHSMISNNSEDISSPASFCNLPLPPSNQQSHTEVLVERKRLIKKPRHCFSSSSWEHKRTAEGGTRKRDNDLHKLLFMPNGLPDGTSLAYYSKGKMILGGYKQGNGIVCSCCNTEISPSQFEAHAGWAAKRQPYRHIYTSTGLTLHDVALMLANGQNLSTSGSDDMCTICGDGGELAVCNGCPRAFHAACLGSQHVPADDWHCPYCRDKFGPARKASSDSRSIIVRLKRVVKAPEDVPGGCVVCRIQDFSATKFDDRTVIICDQCEKEYHVGCLRQCGLCDLKELPEDKWFCRDECHKIFEALQSLANSGPEMIPTPVFASIYKKHTTLGLSDESKNETHIQWRVLSGKSRFPEHLLHLSRAAAIFRECFDPIVTTSGRDLIPVMVYGRNISGQEFYGMYCVVLLVESVVVSAALLRIFGQEVAELPLVATARENQGKGYFQALFSCIERFLSSLNVKLLVLPAAEEAEAMWTKKLGFRRTSNEQMLKYTRDLQLTIFAGTSLLEKEVQHIAD